MKMNVTGIVAEYNPFHNGHAYQIREASKANRLRLLHRRYKRRFCPAGRSGLFSVNTFAQKWLFCKRRRSGA